MPPDYRRSRPLVVRISMENIMSLEEDSSDAQLMDGSVTTTQSSSSDEIACYYGNNISHVHDTEVKNKSAIQQNICQWESGAPFTSVEDAKGFQLTLVLEDIGNQLDDMNTITSCSTPGRSIRNPSSKLPNSDNTIKTGRRTSSPLRGPHINSTRESKDSNRTKIALQHQVSSADEQANDGLTVLFEEIDFQLDDMNTVVGSTTIGSTNSSTNADASSLYVTLNESNLVDDEEFIRWLKSRKSKGANVSSVGNVTTELDSGMEMGTGEPNMNSGSQGQGQNNIVIYAEDSWGGHKQPTKVHGEHNPSCCHKFYRAFVVSSCTMKLVLVMCVLLAVASLSFLVTLLLAHYYYSMNMMSTV